MSEHGTEQDLDDAIFAAERYGEPIPGATEPEDPFDAWLYDEADER